MSDQRQTDAEVLRVLIVECERRDYARAVELLRSTAASIESNTREAQKYQALQEIGETSAKCLAEMVAALECDYDRLEELREEREGWEEDEDLPEPRAKHWAIAYPDEAEELAELEAAAGDCEDREDAEQRIQEDPLSIELSGTWSAGTTPEADRAIILLGTGGPAVRIVCELNSSMEPCRAWIEAQDWGTSWTEYRGNAISHDDLLTYCSQFYFGEG